MFFVGGGKWTQLKPNSTDDEWPPALQEHTMVHYNGKLYIFGGEIGMTDDFATPLWIYSTQVSISLDMVGCTCICEDEMR